VSAVLLIAASKKPLVDLPLYLRQRMFDERFA